MRTPYTTVTGLRRGLQVLRALSRLGEATTAAIAQETGLPRPTAHRLLETLRAEGYVHRKSLREPYRLALLVRTLADGYRDEDWIVEIGEPVLAQLRADVIWPTDLATYADGYMVVRSTTHDSSPLSIERIPRGRRISMLTTATGRTYLAFCPRNERSAILELLDGIPGMRRPALLDREIAATRARGYGLRIRGSQPKTSSIAVPVMSGSAVLACLNINWIDTALKPETAVRRYLAPLRVAAAEISRQYARQRSYP